MSTTTMFINVYRGEECIASLPTPPVYWRQALATAREEFPRDVAMREHYSGVAAQAEDRRTGELLPVVTV